MEKMRFTDLFKCHMLPIFIVLYLCISPTTVSCSEAYYIDNHTSLLYKVINWWYDCHPKYDRSLCGKTIKYTNLGNAHIEYTESNSILKISMQKGFADLLSTFKTCKKCFGPSYFRCTWQSEKYAGKGKAALLYNFNQFIFHRIEKRQAHVLKKIEKDILFIIEGKICGLMNNGKIALYNEDGFLKTCPLKISGKDNFFPISVKIMNGKTKEIIAQYLGIWEN